MKIFDISRGVSPEVATWAGDSATELRQTMSIVGGDSVNVTYFSTSTHSGTHIDAPFHFNRAGDRIEQLDLFPFWGDAQVVSVPKSSGKIYPEDLSQIDLGASRRLLVHTACSHLSENEFPINILVPSQELITALGATNCVLFGTDAPSVDLLDDKELRNHHAFNNLGISILEGLNLSNVPDGIYELSALPLKILKSDGAPCRAVLKRIQE